jgi:1-deoxy-D-xylulose 5-phosphate reductoisomerase
MSRESATAPLERSSTGTVRRVSIVGSTGSIGTQALDVIRTDPERYVVESLGARSSEPSCGSARPPSNRWRRAVTSSSTRSSASPV